MENHNQEPKIPLDEIFGLVITVAFALVALDRIVSYTEGTLPIIDDPKAAFITTVAVFYAFHKIAKPIIDKVLSNFGYHNFNYWEIGNDGISAEEIRRRDLRYKLPREQRKPPKKPK